MKELTAADIKIFLIKTWQILKKIKIMHLIGVLSLIALTIVGYLYIKTHIKKKNITKQAQEIITQISENQKKFFENNGRFDKEYFKGRSSRHFSSRKKRRKGYAQGFDFEEEKGPDFDDSFIGPASKRNGKNKKYEDFSSQQDGDFYIEVDADNGCMVLKYKRNTVQKTTFYASFKEGKAFCLGKNCLEQSQPDQGSVCYSQSQCSLPSLIEETERSCGDGHGKQTRNCVPSCYGGRCEVWGECVCEKGFGWNGTTCVQLETEEDCADDQCFNGIYCEDKKSLVKEIENGTCKRYTSCQKNRGWKYSSWQCSCSKENFCALEENCIAKPEKQESLTLENGEGNCTDISYTCQEGKGWQALAANCICNKVGTFWDNKAGLALCSKCTNKPENSHFTSVGKNKDDCSWKCDDGFQQRKGKCLKPDGKYLCIAMNNQICTDDFSKERKLKKDIATNEGQSCYVEDKDNILFYDTKSQKCQICQCVDVSVESLQIKSKI